LHQEREGEVPVETNWQAPSLAEIWQHLKQSMPYITERYNVKSLGIFGSYVQKAAKKSSDLILLLCLLALPLIPSLL
jgi:hypothetical protein